MAKKKWKVLPGGRIKRWKKSEKESKNCCGMPPHWYRNHLNRRERRKARTAIFRGATHNKRIISRTASWNYW